MSYCRFAWVGTACWFAADEKPIDCAGVAHKQSAVERNTEVVGTRDVAQGTEPERASDQSDLDTTRPSAPTPAPVSGHPQPEALEALAAYAHEAWSGWMRHLWSKCSRAALEGRQLYIPKEWRERWERQMNTPYAELSEDEKESDRAEARKMLAIINQTSVAQDSGERLGWDTLVTELKKLPIYMASRRETNDGTTFHGLAFKREDVSQLIDKLRSRPGDLAPHAKET